MARYKTKRKRGRKRGPRRRSKTIRGGFNKPLLNLGGSDLFNHINLSNSFFPNILGNLKNNINTLLGGKKLFKNNYSNILNLVTK
tara:strand:- start:334 stop:588 length:255 start_codon:yes stop_codon:yes gene_type:complete